MHLLVDFGDYHKCKNSRYFSLFCFLQSIKRVAVKSLPTPLLLNFKVRYTNSENYLSSAPCLTKQIIRGAEAKFKKKMKPKDRLITHSFLARDDQDPNPDLATLQIQRSVKSC